MDYEFWSACLWPLCRLLLGMSFGLALATSLEVLGWTDWLAKLANPVCRWGRFGPAAAASFSLAFVSPAGANGLLSENYENGKIDKRELTLANLLNAFPAYCVHAPGIFLLAWPALGPYALAYLGLTFVAAAGRTALIVLVGRIGRAGEKIGPLLKIRDKEKKNWRQILNKGWSRFKKRLPKLLCMTTPVYLAVFFCQSAGYFKAAEAWLGENIGWLPLVSPQAISLIFLQMATEMGATLGAASAALQDGALSGRDVILALLIGSLLATPLRAIRHQLPSYAGFFRLAMAIRLVVLNQLLRAFSMIIIISIYAFTG